MALAKSRKLHVDGVEYEYKFNHWKHRLVIRLHNHQHLTVDLELIEPEKWCLNRGCCDHFPSFQPSNAKMILLKELNGGSIENFTTGPWKIASFKRS